jgi:hypothetical protein
MTNQIWRIIGMFVVAVLMAIVLGTVSVHHVISHDLLWIIILNASGCLSWLYVAYMAYLGLKWGL